jgi:hypothetical protein
MGGLGEPELVGAEETEHPVPLQVLESPTGPLGLWWRRRSHRARRRLAWTAAAFLALLAFLASYLTWPQAVPRTPTAWPALRATVVYQGLLRSSASSPRTSVFVITVANADVAPMTVTQIRFNYQGLTLRTDPLLPVSVQPGQTATIRLVTTAADCTKIPRNDQLPFVDVTFRNTRAMEQESEILGDRYTADLHDAMTLACHRS